MDEIYRSMERFLDSETGLRRIMVGSRVYELIPFVNKDERGISDEEMIKRAKKLNAFLGEEDCNYILEHQDDIPIKLRENVNMVFPRYRYPKIGAIAVVIYWSDNIWPGSREHCWYVYFRYLDCIKLRSDHFLRRIR